MSLHVNIRKSIWDQKRKRPRNMRAWETGGHVVCMWPLEIPRIRYGLAVWRQQGRCQISIVRAC
jgi:hypothetical protein